MEEEIEKRENGNDEDKWVNDSSVDHKGKLPLRSSTGVWKASLFIIAIEFSERLSYFGIATNLISYLTKVIHEDLGTAAKTVNYWSGVTTLMPLIGGFLADSYSGRFNMVLFSSIIYLLGLILLTMSQFVPSLKPCTIGIGVCQKQRKTHEVVFFLAMYFISLGTGGHKPCLESFGADQFDDDNSEERKSKMSFFNWWNFALCCGLVLGVTVIVYVQDNVNWGYADLILTIVMAITILIFYAGKSCYRYRIPEGSPLTPMLHVLVAAWRNRKFTCPTNLSLLYEVPRSKKNKARLLVHTNRLRFLDKAAIIMDENENTSNHHKVNNPWTLSTVTKVEETKLIISTIPIWLTSLSFGLCLAQAPTFFVKQAATMNRNINNHFVIPAASLYALGAIGMIISVTMYEKILVPFFRRVTGDERGIQILQRVGIGMVFSVLSMCVAALVEKNRLRIVEKEGSSMSVFWVAPQYMILGLGDGFTLVGLQEYFYEQVPDGMRSLGIAFYLSVIGVGSFLSSFLIVIVDHVVGKGVGNGWVGKDLKSSRLDKFYWLLAGLSGLNFCVYVVLARKYTYKSVGRRDLELDDVE